LGVDKVGTWWNKLALRHKLQIPIQLVLLVVLTIAQIWIMKQFEAKMLHGATQNAQSSAMQSFLAINAMMLNGTISQTETRSTFIKKMAGQDDVTEFHLVRGKPVSDSFGTGLPEENTADEVDNQAISRNTVQTRVHDGDKHDLRVVVPIAASQNFHGTNCIQCHVVTEGTVMGAISLTVNLEQEEKELRNLNAWLGRTIWFAIVAIFPDRGVDCQCGRAGT